MFNQTVKDTIVGVVIAGIILELSRQTVMAMGRKLGIGVRAPGY